MSDNILSLEEIVAANEKNYCLTTDDGKQLGVVRIRALDTSEALEIFEKYDTEVPEEGKEIDASENVGLMNEVVMTGLVEPSVDNDSVNQLGRFKVELFNEILSFSGLADEEAMSDDFQDGDE